MFSGGNRTTKVFRGIIDVLNLLMGLAVIVFAVLTFMNPEGNKWMFPIIFMLGGLVNCITGIKHIMCERKVQGIILEVVAVALFAVMYFTYVAVS